MPALAGTGPYMIKRWDEQRGGLLVRNPRFRARSPDRPDGFPDQITIRFQKPKAEIAAVEDGAADIAVFDGPTRYAARLRAQYGARLHTDPAPGTAYAFLNVRTRPFDDVRVRRALNYAVDRGRLAELVGTSETHKPTCQMLPPGFQGYTPSCRYTVIRTRGYLDGPRPGQGTPARRRLRDARHEGRIPGHEGVRCLRALLSARSCIRPAIAAPCGPSPISA